MYAFDHNRLMPLAVVNSCLRFPAEVYVEPKLVSTASLIQRIRGGDSSAKGQLFETYLPLLRQWTRGRLPHYARQNHSETDDLVQSILLTAIQKMEDFHPTREGAFLAYLRTMIMNAIRDEIRYTGRHKLTATLGDDGAHPEATPLENLVGKETLNAYEKALLELDEIQREAVILRIEFKYSFAEIAAAIDRPSADAARMIVNRALAKIAKALP